MTKGNHHKIVSDQCGDSSSPHNPEQLENNEINAKIIIPNSDIGATETIIMEGLDLNQQASVSRETSHRQSQYQNSTVSVTGDESTSQYDKYRDENGNDPEVELAFDQGYAWVILIVGTMINAFSWGASGSYGVFLANYLSTRKYPNTTRMDFAFVGGLQFGIGLSASPVITWGLQYFSYNLFVVIGSFMQVGAYIAVSFATQKWHLYLSQGLLSGLSIAMVFVPANSLLPQWFLHKRGIANGVFTSGAGMGSIIFNLSVQAMVDKIGMQWAQRYVGILCCVMLLICAIFVKERRSLFKRKLKVINFELLARADIWMAIIWGVFTMLCYGIVLYTLAPFAVSIGLTHQQASVLSSLLSAGIIVGRPLLGYLADVIGSINAALLSTFLSTLFILAWWIPSNSYSSLIVLAFFLGAVVSSFSVGFPPICASIVKFEELGSMISMSWAIIGSCNVFSTPIAIGLTTINGSYLYSQIFTGLLFFVSGLILMVTRAIQLRNKEMKSEKCLTEIEIENHKTKPLYKLLFKSAKV